MKEIKQITPCPIIEATILVNCKFNVPSELAIGLIYSNLKAQNLSLGKLEQLPVFNIPKEFRNADPNLRKQPTSRFFLDGFAIMTGLYGMSISLIGDYKGWESFYSMAKEVWKAVSPLIVSISSIELHYLNFFECNIFENINCKILLNKQQITTIPTIFRTEVVDGKFIKALQVSNGVNFKNRRYNVEKKGSLVDINIVSKNVNISTFEANIDEAHSIEKTFFYSLLPEDFINTFVVEYYE